MRSIVCLIGIAIVLSAVLPAAAFRLEDDFNDGNANGWTLTHSYTAQGANTLEATDAFGSWDVFSGQLRLTGSGSTAAGDFSSVPDRYNLPANLAMRAFPEQTYGEFELKASVTQLANHPNYVGNSNFVSIGLFDAAGQSGYFADITRATSGFSWAGMNVRRMTNGDLTDTLDFDGRLASLANGRYSEWDATGAENEIQSCPCDFTTGDQMDLTLALAENGDLSFTVSSDGNSTTLTVSDPFPGGALSRFGQIRLYGAWSTPGHTWDDIVLTPEPASLLMVAIGALTLHRRRRIA